MQKKYKILLVIIFLLILVLGGFALYMHYFNGDVDTNQSTVVASMKDYGYTLDDRDSKLMHDEFANLKEVLESEEIDYLEYAKCIGKLFIVDLYTIDNKINKYDVGGLEYLKEKEKDKFKNIIIDSIYSNVLDNANNVRNQELPVVSEINVDNVSESTYEIDKETYDSIVLELSWKYETNYGYDDKAQIVIIKENNKLFIVEYTPIVLDEGVEE